MEVARSTDALDLEGCGLTAVPDAVFTLTALRPRPPSNDVGGGGGRGLLHAPQSLPNSLSSVFLEGWALARSVLSLRGYATSPGWDISLSNSPSPRITFGITYRPDTARPMEFRARYAPRSPGPPAHVTAGALPQWQRHHCPAPRHTPRRSPDRSVVELFKVQWRFFPRVGMVPAKPTGPNSCPWF